MSFCDKREFFRLVNTLSSYIDSAPLITIEYDRSLFPKKRDLAFTDGETIYFSDKIFDLPVESHIALIAHELAHVDLFDQTHSERDADDHVRDLFSMHIYYDIDDIQTVRPTQTNRRPSHLPK